MRGVTANGSEIISVRSMRGLTQDQLATHAGLDVKTIRKAEQSKRIDFETLTRLAFSLDTDLSRLIVAGSDEPEDRLSRRDVVMQWHRAWEAKDLEGVLAVYTDDAVLSLPGGPSVPFGGVFRGKDEIRRAHDQAWALPMEPLRAEEFAVLINGDNLMIDGYKGVYLPTGELVRFPCLQAFRFRGDLIESHDVQFDTLEFAKRMKFPI